MEIIKNNFIGIGLLPEPLVNSIYKKIRKAKKNIDNNQILSYMIEDFDSYIDLDGNPKQKLIPNYLNYKYKKIELIVHEVFKNDSDKDLILAVANAMYKCNVAAIENNSDDIMNQTTEELSENSTNTIRAMSEAIGGSNIHKSTAVFKYEMVFAFSINIKEETIKKTIPVVQKSCDLISQNRCVVCDEIAFSTCGRCKIQTYCSKDCQKIHWKSHKHECK